MGDIIRKTCVKKLNWKYLLTSVEIKQFDKNGETSTFDIYSIDFQPNSDIRFYYDNNRKTVNFYNQNEEIEISIFEPSGRQVLEKRLKKESCYSYRNMIPL